MTLAGSTILITGAASGIGRAWVLGFLAEGARVYAVDIDATGLEALAAQGAVPVVADVADAMAVGEFVARAWHETGRLDALFNNAGLGFGVRVEDCAPGQFERHVAVHLFGTVNGMRHAIPRMRTQGHGRIVNTISRNAEFDQPGTSAYGAAKAAIWTTSRVAARELAGTNVLINMLIPGPTNTAIWGRARPELQSPEATWPTARMLAMLPAGGPSGQVFWNEKPYRMFAGSSPA